MCAMSEAPEGAFFSSVVAFKRLSSMAGIPIDRCVQAQSARPGDSHTHNVTDFAVSLVGRDVDLLIEKPGRESGQQVGRSPWLQPVIVDETAGKIGDIVGVRINKAGSHSLHAAVV